MSQALHLTLLGFEDGRRGALKQDSHAASRSYKKKGMDSMLKPRKGAQPC
jgi:hypothetical protein